MGYYYYNILHNAPLTYARVFVWVTGATKDMGKMLGGEEEKDPDAAKKEEERQEALRQQEEERKAKHARMESEREKVRQNIRDKVNRRAFIANVPCFCPLSVLYLFYPVLLF